MGLEDAGELEARELTSLVGIHDLGDAVFGDGFLQGANADVSTFGKWADEIISAYVGRSVSATTVLAYSNKPLDLLDGASVGRGHIDSLRQQQRYLCFLRIRRRSLAHPNGWLERIVCLSSSERSPQANTCL